MKASWFLALVLLPLVAAADERILEFHSDIKVFPDGNVEVTETITVRAEGKQIRRGIYRDFPVEYVDRLGNEHHIRLQPLVVMRNDRREDFHTVRSGRDVRTYFGHKDRYIERGEHTYLFRYRVNRMLGFFDGHDELYWNVTGNEWAFPIDKATATVRLEFDAPRDALALDGYTGRLGSNAQEYGRFVDGVGDVHFQADKPLPVAHGLTIVVGWPKGYVEEPSTFDRARWVLADNANLLVVTGGLALLFLYYIPLWHRHGRDPEEGVIVTRYTPPSGFSPASLRYIRQMYYDNKVMTAAIVNLAVKGYLEIEKSGDKHTLRKAGRGTLKPAMAPGEQELFSAIFSEGDVVVLENENHEVLGKARSEHRESLKKDYKEHYFRTNGWLNLPAVIFVVLVLVVALNTGRGATIPVIAIGVLSLLTVVFFAIIMKRPTIRGRQLLDEMLGFKDYLEIAEKDELNLRNPPQKTPALFETMLPYALALGVEQAWSEKFAAMLASIRNPDGSGYSPTWYNGHWSTSNLMSSTNSLTGGLNSAVSSAVTPPGSSSGGGGGGFSGGGGGGGGGGGW